MDKKVIVESMTNATVGVHVPDIRLHVNWERKGAKKPVSFELLQQAMYDPGVEYMFKEGMLYIDDMEAKIALGLEPEDAKEPQNIIVLDDKQRRRYLTVMPLADFKTAMGTLPSEQIKALVDFAVQNEIIDMEKDKVLQELTGVNIVKAIELNRLDKEPIKESEKE